jgi:hypothetical protein
LKIPAHRIPNVHQRHPSWVQSAGLRRNAQTRRMLAIFNLHLSFNWKPGGDGSLGRYAGLSRGEAIPGCPPTTNFPRSPVSLPPKPGIDRDGGGEASPKARHPRDRLPREPGTACGSWPITRCRAIDPRSTDRRDDREKGDFAGKSFVLFSRPDDSLSRLAVPPRTQYCVTKEGSSMGRLP